jgi:D-alanine-D-alanine ligase
MPELQRPPSARARRRPARVAILYNVDYRDSSPDGDPGYTARADVEHVAHAVADELARAKAFEACLVPVDGDLAALRAKLADLEPDCAFNLCESLAGDTRLESAVPLVLDLLGLPFTGSPPEALSHALYKDRVKRRLLAAGVPTPSARVLTNPGDAEAVSRELRFPLIVKPVREDGSAGITSKSVVYSTPELAAAAALVTRAFRQPCLVEQYIAGREFNVSLLGFPAARVLPLSEIDFSALPAGMPPIVSYEAKWSEGSVEDLGTRPVLLPELPNALAARVRRVAVEAFRAVGVRDYGRVDVRLSAAGVPYVVDVNPNCDLARNAGLARAAAAVGLDYASLVTLLVRYALRRRRGAKETGIARASAAGSPRASG